MLYIFGGLPATGKSELSTYLARTLSAVHLRVDTIEQAMRDRGITVDRDQGYVVAYRIARDNLQLGLDVVSDSVNPLDITRDAWRRVAIDTDVHFLEIEVICSDKDEHRRRVETRRAQVRGLVLPDWQAVLDREYHEWDDARIVIDTAGQTPAESKLALERAIEIETGHE